MHQDFERTQAALASSVAGRALIFLSDAIESAWRASSSAQAARSFLNALRSLPATALLRTIAVAVIIAAVVQPLLIAAMPATVRPAMPWWVFGAATILAAIVAWQAPAFIKAWPTSAPARLFRR
jgi:hypothetical protein